MTRKKIKSCLYLLSYCPAVLSDPVSCLVFFTRAPLAVPFRGVRSPGFPYSENVAQGARLGRGVGFLHPKKKTLCQRETSAEPDLAAPLDASVARN